LQNFFASDAIRPVGDWKAGFVQGIALGSQALELFQEILFRLLSVERDG
jgi:hypothetical protein